ncbi:hypothetical protein COY93_03825 [Candidatus Uhrbacteria bacterium CG_4_10_14_0_8_um_filter_58_22]|uniref:Uncharacterized protein n=1 Tax=Candidatus Uhrbacteria bacterium CG_4_10_14_0_8_um_filter_58_22 TaxID=1975029 RepID=A0A2M7QAI3_9BACT|nr:MAG: hypothetical protein AUJ19_00620 [Parcubacteria group bacterium CG1_02_58_44]PIY62120.1 MAG: hypothetical protein COY93_03825 [Candidatus Uhrbacteria bacterium CG_4_10_14_0_8_um_filter_58_22]
MGGNETYPNNVTYRILVETSDGIKKIANIIIDSFGGDIYYVPSERGLIEESRVSDVVDHVSFHATGAVLIKRQGGTYITCSGRSALREIGYQKMLEDHVYDITALPVQTKKLNEIDIVLNPKNETAVTFQFSIISGRLIANPDVLPGVTVNAHTPDEDLLHSARMCLGWHSGNADKFLQYALHRLSFQRNSADLKAKRTLYIPPDSNVRRPKQFGDDEEGA